MTFHRTIIYCTHVCKKLNENPIQNVQFDTYFLECHSQLQYDLFAGLVSSAVREEVKHSLVLHLSCAYWLKCELGWTTLLCHHRGGKSFHFDTLPFTIILVSLTVCGQRLKDRLWYVKKQNWQIYSMLLSEGDVHDDQDTATKTTLSTIEDQPFWQLYLTEVYMYSKIISSVESLELCHKSWKQPAREIQSFRSPWLFVQRAGSPLFL